MDGLGDDNNAARGSEVSTRIRERLLQAKRRFNANDNIADFIEPGELDLLLEEVAAKIKAVLEGLVIDIENDHNTQIGRAHV